MWSNQNCLDVYVTYDDNEVYVNPSAHLSANGMNLLSRLTKRYYYIQYAFAVNE